MLQKRTQLGYALISMIILSSCGGAPPPPPPPPVNVSVYPVAEGTAAYSDDYAGTITSLQAVDIRPQVSGYITDIYFQDGQHVTKGQKLYAIDKQQYVANYDQAVANLSVANANEAKAQQDADRYQELAKNDAIAKQTLDHAVADLQSAKMQVQASKASAASLENNVRFSTINAPLTGTIGISQVKVGAVVTPGQTVLNTVSGDGPIAVDVNVDERQIPYFLKLQQKADAKDSTFQLILTDQSVYPYYGHIAFIDRAVDPQTGTIKARLVFPNPNNMLRDGMNCNVRVNNNGGGQQLLIPYKAVVEQLGEYFVFVADGGKAIQHKVTLATKINDKVVVSNGLQTGDSVITEGVQKLRDSSNIKVTAVKTK
ncbi:MAG TPA: efflux RND transporter periplasmic adaptor subunit [Ferruginibacter sp.]|jgi:RND family efflux transporter MFP subunit|nr:efflux RND transporter periplasmic adaptor subunit [Ferruginibacter sp.]